MTSLLACSASSAWDGGVSEFCSLGADRTLMCGRPLSPVGTAKKKGRDLGTSHSRRVSILTESEKDAVRLSAKLNFIGRRRTFVDIVVVDDDRDPVWAFVDDGNRLGLRLFGWIFWLGRCSDAGAQGRLG
jgi:hypothetical protein